jgi:hypothetical protein
VPFVSHVPQLHLQLFSANQITNHGCVILDSNICFVQLSCTDTSGKAWIRIRYIMDTYPPSI